MSDYYEITGELAFPSVQDARDAVASLRAIHEGEATFFWMPPRDPEKPAPTDLVAKNSVVTFAWKGFAGGAESYYTTLRILKELAKKAESGRVRVKGPDGNEAFAPRTRAAKKKPASPRRGRNELPTISCDEPLIVLARGYAHLWDRAKFPRLFEEAMSMKAPAALDLVNVDALVLPAGPPTSFVRDEDEVLLLRAEAGGNVALAEVARELPPTAWEAIECRMTGGSHGALLVIKASNPGKSPNQGTKGLRIPVVKRPWPHVYYGVSVATVSKMVGESRVAGSVIRLSRKE